MNIKAKATLDFDAVKALAYVTMSKKREPKKNLLTWAVICGILEIIAIAEMVAFGVSETMMMLCTGIVVMYLISFCFYFLVPKSLYNAMSKLKNAVNEYTFQDDLMHVVTKKAEFSGESEIQYSYVYKIFETSKYFFIFQTKNQALIVDKQTFEGGTTAELREKLMPLLGKKYIVCNY